MHLGEKFWLSYRKFSNESNSFELFFTTEQSKKKWFEC